MPRKEQQLLQVKINKASGKVENDKELKDLQGDGWQIAQIQGFDFNDHFSFALLLLERDAPPVGEFGPA